MKLLVSASQAIVHSLCDEECNTDDDINSYITKNFIYLIIKVVVILMNTSTRKQDQVDQRVKINPFMDGSFSEWLACAESASHLPSYLTAGAEQ